MRTKDIAEAIAGRLDGDGAIEVDRLVHPARAERPTDLALAISADAAAALAQSKAQAAVISAKNPAPSGALRAVIFVDETRLSLAKLTALFDPGPAHDPGIHPTAIVAADAELGAGVSVGAYAVVGARSRIGAGTTIMPHVTIGADVTIGARGLFHSGVRIGDRISIGDRVIVHANAVIGSDGFSFAPDMTSPIAFTSEVTLMRIHSLGSVAIGDDVEIGASTTIDRATLETTRIGHGTKIDNHVHIGHNVSIGETCVICGMVGISGSVIIGNRVRLGGGVRRRRSCPHRRSGSGSRRLRGCLQRGGRRFCVGLSGDPAPAVVGTNSIRGAAKAAARKGGRLGNASRRNATNGQEVMGALAL